MVFKILVTVSRGVQDREKDLEGTKLVIVLSSASALVWATFEGFNQQRRFDFFDWRPQTRVVNCLGRVQIRIAVFAKEEGLSKIVEKNSKSKKYLTNSVSTVSFVDNSQELPCESSAEAELFEALTLRTISSRKCVGIESI